NNEEFFHAEFNIDNDIFQKELGNTVLVLEDGVTAFIPTFSYKKHVTEHSLQKGAKKVVIEGLLKDKKINVRKEKNPNSDKQKGENEK
ncbi:MAG: hypothetical protein J7497_05870, partial [Chitinophagaceae bacterium]|nr:hypothetical protein [Chitinophagaceae bacterium]